MLEVKSTWLSSLLPLWAEPGFKSPSPVYIHKSTRNGWQEVHSFQWHIKWNNTEIYEPNKKEKKIRMKIIIKIDNSIKSEASRLQ